MAKVARGAPRRAAALPTGNVTNFINYLNVQQLDNVMSTFGANPKVGITSYGPQFIGASAVQRLFRQLFASFPNVALTQQPPVPATPSDRWLFSDPTVVLNPVYWIGIQMTLSGIHSGAWFAAGTPNYSPPLSTIAPNSTRSMDLDASVIFSLEDDTAGLISQISIYFDRYLMAQQLGPVSQARQTDA